MDEKITALVLRETDVAFENYCTHVDKRYIFAGGKMGLEIEGLRDLVVIHDKEGHGLIIPMSNILVVLF
jgi:hypothetical protein